MSNINQTEMMELAFGLRDRGIGFKVADDIAKKLGIDKYSRDRIFQGILYLWQKNNHRRVKNMKEYTVADKETSIILGILVMTPDQARRAERDFIVKEV